MKRRLAAWALALTATSLPMASQADVNVGVTISLTGPGASLGIPTQNAIRLFPKEIAGQKINYIVLDDASDGSNAVKNFVRLVDESKADVVMGSSTSPSTMPLVTIAAERKVPLISLAASARIVEPQDATRRWTFKAIANENIVVGATIDHMAASGVKTLGFIGFSDAYGESWLNETKAQIEKHGIQ